MARAPRERFVEHALALIAQTEVAPPEAAEHARRLLNTWRSNSPEHEDAALEARRRWDTLGSLSAELRTHFEEPVPREDRPPARTRRTSARSRRKLLLSVAAAVALGALGTRGLHWHRQQPIFASTYGTQIAQMLKVTLPDAADRGPGSQLDLAPQSRIQVALYRQRRSVELLGGEIRFAVASDAARPFVVRTREAQIEVVGTVFTVRDRGGPVSVGVEDGHVRVRMLSRGAEDAPAVPGTAVDLHPGEYIEIQEGHVDTLRRTDTTEFSAWRDGWLVFENTALGEALSTINAYRPQPIGSTDPRVRMLRLSGRFRSNDSAGLVAVLPTILPLTARTNPDGSVDLQAR